MRIFLFFIVFCFSTGLSLPAEEVARVVAAVNNQVITSKDVSDYCAAMAYRLEGEAGGGTCDDPEVRKEALYRLIDDKLVLAEAKKGQLEVPRGMVDEHLSRIILSYPSREAFEQSLVEKGLTVTSLREILKEKILMQSVVEFNVKSFINISPQEITDFYQNNQESFYTPQTYVFYIAESQRRQELDEIIDTIDSQGVKKALRQFGAMLFPVESTRAELRPEIGNALSDLSDGSYVIVDVEDRHYLIYRDHVNEPRMMPISEVSEQIVEYLKDRQFKKRFTEWLSQLRETAVIKHYGEI
jgi:hypothetical protein